VRREIRHGVFQPWYGVSSDRNASGKHDMADPATGAPQHPLRAIRILP
jgi:hypothetical protein